MKIWWCQEHGSGVDSDESRVCDAYLTGRYSEPCRMVPMRLVPDNAETVETVKWCEEHGSTGFPDEPICVWHRMVQAQGVYTICRMVEADLIVRHAALDGETP